MGWKQGYGQFCPVAMAAEVFAVRWTPLVLRELLAGSARFAELRRGLPRISPAMLSQRLRELVDVGVVQKAGDTGRPPEYHLTEADEAMRPVIEALGVWGQHWAQHELRPDEVDPELLMWANRRALRLAFLPCPRAVLRYEFPDVPIAVRRFWLVVERGEVDLCLKDPGREVDLSVLLSVRTLARIYLGQLEPEVAVRSGAVVLQGARALVRTFPLWCARSTFAAEARRSAF